MFFSSNPPKLLFESHKLNLLYKHYIKTLVTMPCGGKGEVAGFFDFLFFVLLIIFEIAAIGCSFLSFECILGQLLPSFLDCMTAGEFHNSTANRIAMPFTHKYF